MSISHFLESENESWKNVTFNNVNVKGASIHTGNDYANGKVIEATTATAITTSTTLGSSTYFGGLVVYNSASALSIGLPTALNLYNFAGGSNLSVNSTVRCLMVNKGSASGAVTLTNSDSNNDISNLLVGIPITSQKLVYARLTQVSPPKFSYYG